MDTYKERIIGNELNKLIEKAPDEETREHLSSMYGLLMVIALKFYKLAEKNIIESASDGFEQFWNQLEDKYGHQRSPSNRCAKKAYQEATISLLKKQSKGLDILGVSVLEDNQKLQEENKKLRDSYALEMSAKNREIEYLKNECKRLYEPTKTFWNNNHQEEYMKMREDLDIATSNLIRYAEQDRAFPHNYNYAKEIRNRYNLK